MKNDKEQIWLKALDVIKEVLDNNNCQYFLDTGTLLGAIRDHQFIPWDNDIDLGVVDCQETKKTILNICKQLYNKGYNVTASEHELDIFDRSGLLDLGVKFYDHNGNNYETSFGKICGSQLAHMLYGSLSGNIIFKNGYGSYKFKAFMSKALRVLSLITPRLIVKKLMRLSKIESRNLSIPVHLLSHFSDFEFYGRYYKVPSNSLDYLQYRYGKDWNKPNRNYNFINDDKSIKK